MTEKEKLELAEEIMDVEEDTYWIEVEFENIDEWDSLSALTLIVESKKRWGKVITTEIIDELKTVSDLCELFEA